MHKLAIITIAWIAAGIWLQVAQAQQDNMYFSGTLVAEPCNLAIEDETVELNFSNISDKDLYLNRRTLGHPIFLHLQNCDLASGQRFVDIIFHGVESDQTPGLLVLDKGAAEGAVIGLETQRGKALPLNKTHRMAELASGMNVISFKAYLQGEADALANRSIGLGEFLASLTFVLSYE